MPPALRSAPGRGRAVQGSASLPCCAPLPLVAPFPSLTSSPASQRCSSTIPPRGQAAPGPVQSPRRPSATMPTPRSGRSLCHRSAAAPSATRRPVHRSPAPATLLIPLTLATRSRSLPAPFAAGRPAPLVHPPPPIPAPSRWSARHRPTRQPAHRTAAVPRRAPKRPHAARQHPLIRLQAAGQKSLPPASKACVQATQAEARPASRRVSLGSTPSPRHHAPANARSSSSASAASRWSAATTLTRPAPPSIHWGPQPAPKPPRQGI